MTSRIQFPLGIASATLLLLTKSATAVDAGRMSLLNPCLGIDVEDVAFNATGSFKTKQFPDLSKGTDGQNLKEWTWHTGLDGTNLSTPTQYFWVDTTGAGDLNSKESPYNGTCMTIFDLNVDSDYWNNPQNDTGDCQSMIGEACLKAIGSGPINAGAGRCSDTKDFDIPKECPMLKDFSSSTFEFFPKFSRGSTCNSTEDNADGSKSVFYSTSLENPEVTDFALYDKMAKVGRFIIAMPRYTDESSGETKSEIKYMCMRNTDFAAGSRNPLPANGGPPMNSPTAPSGNDTTNGTTNGTPTGTGDEPKTTGAAVKGGVSFVSLATALFVGVFVLFN